VTSRLLVPDRLVTDTVKALRQFRGWFHRHEGVGYWLGWEQEEITVALTLAIPRATTWPGRFHVVAAENARVTATAHSQKCIVVAQIHSHPGSDTSHSGGDNRDAFMPSEGYFSLVVPSYAQGNPPLKTWGIHRYERGEFRRLSNSEVSTSVFLTPSVVDLR
jgi:proteasome lid subunit RPN8/RPN11